MFSVSGAEKARNEKSLHSLHLLHARGSYYIIHNARGEADTQKTRQLCRVFNGDQCVKLD